MPSTSFDPYNSSSLDMPEFVLRDNLGNLAIQILSSKNDLSKMSYRDMLEELLSIINELQYTYEHLNL